MTTKVFLFDSDIWLYCDDLSYDGNGCYQGHVINGNYSIVIDTVVNVVNHDYGTHESKLVWACDPFKSLFDYNSVIQNVKERYETGEPANYVLKETVYDDEDDEVPF